MLPLRVEWNALGSSKHSHLGEFGGSTTGHLLHPQVLELSLELIELLGELGLVLGP